MANKLWGGRFSKKTDPLVEKFTKSIQYDYKIAKYDVLGSILHVFVLRESGFLSAKEQLDLVKELGNIFEDFENNRIAIDDKCEDEDIHTYIQNILQNKLGDLVLKLHMARSRNDQVVFSTKLYSKVELGNLKNEIKNLASEIKKIIKKNNQMRIPGFTHLQHAQPVYLKDYLGVYRKMLIRDKERIEYIDSHLKITMGAGALAGSPISASQYKTSLKKLSKKWKMFKKFKKLFNVKPTDNSLDSVSDRDFVIEIISALSVIAMHLSRLAEDLIIWSTKEFDFIELDEAYCTGSSLMPQKKNPDVLELVRGYAGRLSGNLVSVLTIMKGLPLTYNRDMQLDKEPLFDSFEVLSKELKVLQGLIKTLKFNKEKIKEQLQDELLYATDLVYDLVNRKIPFKEAHDIIGELVTKSTKDKKSLRNLYEHFLNNKFLKTEIKKGDIDKLFDSKYSVESKKSIKRE